MLRLLLILSLLANVALWAAWRWIGNSHAGPGEVALAAARDEPAGNAVASGERARAQGAAPNRSAPLAGSTWQTLRGADLRGFAERLRTAGFPPRVVRALVTHAVNQHFSEQREALLHGTEEVPYWRQPPSAFTDPEKLAAFDRLGRERDRLLQELLGADPAGADELARAYQRRRFGDLAPEKIERLQALLANHSERRANLRTPGRPMDADAAQRLSEMEQQLRADIARLLTPQELEQYDLRSSPTAGQVRHRLDTFQPTEEEYKAVFAVQRAIDAQFPPNQPLDPQQLAARRGAEEQAQAQLRAALGPERYADYLQATNSSYSSLNQLVARLELPISAARTVVAVQQEIGNRMRGILTTDTLTPEEQNQRLQALRHDAATKISAALGPRGWEAYQQQPASQWLKTLTKPRP